ncbi:3-carboxyethylcatechol 2,3-dioxygenase [Rhodococcoides fascians A21d2]|uniref:3-carboxyethylcatechol 2,3-dioxygenase n=1 Tax=Rhodococcoides fascians TaxID=1828 RepID=UPI00068E3BA3|nr:3-carboxyethylcatechol 2,3-dioxygenase [Rhodococcus fascians]QII00278.1 3-carboxyethylcatechol 2,3-dioxygenase [Rhodococcus fascians A21d2]
MPTSLIAMSHTPLLGKVPVNQDVESELGAVFGLLRDFVADFEPDVTILFTPDHYNGFFYDIMPPFCVGTAAESIGDFDSPSGPLNVPETFAMDLTNHVLADGVDLTMSKAMKVDHGAVQPLELLFGTIDAHPVVPVFVNGVAEPFTPMHRVKNLGESIGRFVRRRQDRVLLVASGGLSHDPPVPRWHSAAPSARAGLLNGRQPTPMARATREANVMATAQKFAEGTATIQDLNPEWDRMFMDRCRTGDLSTLAGYDWEDMTRDAGHSSHETRTWLAAFAALSASGAYDTDVQYYRPIREYIAGFGAIAARPHEQPRTSAQDRIR